MGKILRLILLEMPRFSDSNLRFSTTAPKQVVREMAQNGYISDVELWLMAIDKRNLSSHTYNELIADEVFNFANDFLSEAQKLLAFLKTK